MKLKEAIAILRDYETPAAIVVLCELRKLKAEKLAIAQVLRQAFLIIREWRCHNTDGRHPCFQSCDEKIKLSKCGFATCPLLKQPKAKPFSFEQCRKSGRDITAKDCRESARLALLGSGVELPKERR